MFLIFQAIAEDANISVTEEDVADYFYEYEGERTIRHTKRHTAYLI